MIPNCGFYILDSKQGEMAEGNIYKCRMLLTLTMRVL